MANITSSSATTSSASSISIPSSQKRSRESDELDDRVACTAEVITDKRPKLDPHFSADELTDKLERLIKGKDLNAFNLLYLTEQQTPGIFKATAGRLLETVFRNYEFPLAEFGSFLYNKYFQDGINPFLSNRICQIFPLISNQNNLKRTLVRRFSFKINPTPFAWSQAVMKLIENDDEKMVLHFWGMTKSAPIAAKLPANWSSLMIAHHQSPSPNNKAFIRLLPMLFQYNYATDTLHADGAEDLRYVDYNNSENWIHAIQVALKEKPNALNMLVSPRFLKQIDLNVRMEAFKILVQDRAFDYAKELFTNHEGFKELSLDQINELYQSILQIPGCGSLLGLLIAERNRKENN